MHGIWGNNYMQQRAAEICTIHAFDQTLGHLWFSAWQTQVVL